MNEEKEKILEELKEEVNKINIVRNPDELNNKSNKPYWDLEKKYKEKLKKLYEKYDKEKENTQ